MPVRWLVCLMQVRRRVPLRRVGAVPLKPHDAYIAKAPRGEALSTDLCGRRAGVAASARALCVGVWGFRAAGPHNRARAFDPLRHQGGRRCCSRPI